jgi:hypothetical protein
VQILAITTARTACIDGDLFTAEDLLTQDINANDNHISYAHRSFVRTRRYNWDHALQDAIKVRYTDPSWAPYERLTRRRHSPSAFSPHE